MKIRFDVLAVQCIRTARNFITDIRFDGILFCLNLRTWRKHGLIDTKNSDYIALSYIFKARIIPTDVLVDVGCRKGRVINFWLRQGLRNRMVGIELDEEIARITRKRLRRYENVSIITGDVLDNIPSDGTLFYLFNPFPVDIMKSFRDQLIRIFGNQRAITLLYHNCKHVDVFQQDPRWIVEVTDVGGRSPLPFAKLAVISLIRQINGVD